MTAVADSFLRWSTPTFPDGALFCRGVSGVWGKASCLRKRLVNDPWEAQSWCTGAGLDAVGAEPDISVTLKDSRHTDAGAEVHVVVPRDARRPDPALFGFHNPHEDYPQESTEVNLGVFPASTPLVFMYVVVDGNEKYDSIVGKKLYSGQNRPGVDEYVSEKVHGDKRRWCVVGTVNSSTVEAGFEDDIHIRYKSIIFEVQGARRGSE